MCSSSLYELLSNYSNYIPLWNASAQHYVSGIRSQFNLDGWRKMLSGGEHKVYGKNGWDFNSHYLLDGVCHGFKLIDPGAQLESYYCENYKSATKDAFVEINDIVCKELKSNKLTIVEQQPHCVHALGAVEKSSGGYRPITDASRPSMKSINNYMDSNHSVTIPLTMCRSL